MSDHIEDIRGTLHRLREKEYPAVPAELLDEILRIEAENTGSPTDAVREIEEKVDAYLGGI